MTQFRSLLAKTWGKRKALQSKSYSKNKENEFALFMSPIRDLLIVAQ